VRRHSGILADRASDPRGFGPRRGSTGRLVLSLIVALGLLFLLFHLQPSWFFAGGTVVPTPVSGIIATPTPISTPKPVLPRYPYIGQAALINSTSITPLGVQYSQGDNANKPNVGDVFAVVLLHIANHQDKDYNLVPNVPCLLAACNFFIRDGEGRKNPPLPFNPYRTQLRSVVLAPGSSIDGSFTFEVPQSDAAYQTLQLLYYDNPIFNADSLTRWLLKLPSRSTPHTQHR